MGDDAHGMMRLGEMLCMGRCCTRMLCMGDGAHGLCCTWGHDAHGVHGWTVLMEDDATIYSSTLLFLLNLDFAKNI